MVMFYTNVDMHAQRLLGLTQPWLNHGPTRVSVTHTYVFTHVKLVGLTSSPLRGLTHVPCRLLMGGVHRAPMSRLRTTIPSRGQTRLLEL